MEWLNYHHFLYFWMTVREGGIKPASRRLRLTHPTVSVQIGQLEESPGAKLFARISRSSLGSQRELALENLALRQQLPILHRKTKRPKLSKADRAFWVAVCGQIGRAPSSL